MIESTASLPAALEAPESAKQTIELAELISLRPSAFVASLDYFTSTIVVSVNAEVKEVSKDPDEEMVDYETTPERGEINVVYLFADYYVVGDDLTVTEFNFATQSASFQNQKILSIISILCM